MSTVKKSVGTQTKPGAETRPEPQKAAANKPAKDRSTFNSLINRFSGVLSKFSNLKPNEQERKALQTMDGMLEPNKLGGKDRVFNHQDRDAIVNSLLKDGSGLVKEATTQLRNEGKKFQAKLVQRAFSGRNNRFRQKIRDRVFREVRSQVEKQLSAGLNEANVDPKQGGNKDTTTRDITFDELRNFERASNIAQQFQDRVTQYLPFKVVFPKGVSQEAMRHTLEGKPGIPPGGAIQKK